MLSLANRIALMAQLGAYMQSNDPKWKQARELSVISNSWFTEESVAQAIEHIAQEFLDEKKLTQWAGQYPIGNEMRTVGITMAGNIPLVGFHDLLCGFISGHRQAIRLSSKDNKLIPHLVSKLIEWAPEVKEYISIQEMLKGCDAYIATGSNNSARYFEQYFGKYPHIIRRNRTSVAVLTGDETDEMLRALAQDVFTYFGLGCRNVTQVCVPEGYDFTQLLNVFRSWEGLMVHHKYKNNYDYHLALYLLNKIPYLTNESLLMVENALPFSPVSVLHYRYYNEREALVQELSDSDDIQCIVGEGLIPFGSSQQPALTDYADGVDTMAFLTSLR